MVEPWLEVPRDLGTEVVGRGVAVHVRGQHGAVAQQVDGRVHLGGC